MPAETVLVLSGVLAAFAFFTAMVVFGDLTWQPRTRRSGKLD